MSELEEEKVIVCSQKKQANKQMNRVFPSEDHIEYEIDKSKAQTQDCRGTPRVAVSADRDLGRLPVLPATAARSRLAAHRTQQPGYPSHPEPKHAAQHELLVNPNLVAGPRTHNLSDGAAAFVVMSS